MSDEQGKISEETAVVYFNVVYQNVSRSIEENYRDPCKVTFL